MRIVASLMLLLVAALGWCQVDMSDMTMLITKPALAIQRPDIKKELKLTKDQDKQIGAIQKELQNEMKGASNGRDLSAGMAVFGKIDEAGKKIIAVLDGPQQKRFFEIRVQMKGPPGFADPEIASLLEISDEQQEKVRAARAAYMSNLVALARSPDKIVKARDAHDVELLAILTDGQRAKFKEIQGAAFKNARPKGY